MLVEIPKFDARYIQVYLKSLVTMMRFDSGYLQSWDEIGDTNRQVRLPETERLNYHQLEAHGRIWTLTDDDMVMGDGHHPPLDLRCTQIYTDIQACT